MIPVGVELAREGVSPDKQRRLPHRHRGQAHSYKISGYRSDTPSLAMRRDGMQGAAELG